MHAEKVVMGVSRDYKRQIRRMNELKNSMDRAQKNFEAREEGKAEGMTNKSIEIARKLKARGHPLSEISEITGLLLEVIEKL